MNALAKTEIVDVDQLYTVSTAAENLGVPRTTLRSAIVDGTCHAWHTGDGVPLVTLDDVRLWWATRKPPGRPRGQHRP